MLGHRSTQVFRQNGVLCMLRVDPGAPGTSVRRSGRHRSSSRKCVERHETSRSCMAGSRPATSGPRHRRTLAVDLRYRGGVVCAGCMSDSGGRDNALLGDAHPRLVPEVWMDGQTCRG
eukprot:820772-Rhodomonas_salina.1